MNLTLRNICLSLIFTFFSCAALANFKQEAKNLCYKITARQKLFKQTQRRLIKKPFYGCSAEIKWIDDLKKAVCRRDLQSEDSLAKALSLIKLSPNYLFYFAGASDFNAKKIKEQIRPVNVTGDEGNDLIGKNWSGRLLKTIFDPNYSPLSREDFLIHYYAGSEFKITHSRKTGQACLRQTYEYMNFIKTFGPTRQRPVKIIIAGFSNGGAMAIDTQLYLGEKDHKVNLVIAIDPVVKASRFLQSRKYGPYKRKHENTKRLISLYQREDIGSLLLLPLRGHPVKDADENILVHCENSDGMGCSGLLNHTQIVNSTLVVETFINELMAL